MGYLGTKPANAVLTSEQIGDGVITSADISSSVTINFADGSASTPSITNDGDTNTGIFFPAADTIAFAEGGVESMRIDSTGDVNLYNAKSFKVYNPANTRFGSFLTSADGTVVSAFNGSGEPLLLTSPTGYFTVSTNGSERMRIASDGNVLIGTASSTGAKFDVTQSINTAAASAFFDSRQATTSNQYGIVQRLLNDPNNTAQYIFHGLGGATERCTIRSNGGIANFSGNNVNLSDAREKTNVELAGSYLNKVCAIPVKTFNYIDQNREEDDGLTLGVIAQDVEAVAPELVMESNWGTQEEPKMRLSIYQTDLQYALMKCIQEQQAIITDLKTRIEALEQA
jgi:hypothetical protein